MAKDEFGLYKRLDECVASEASKLRSLKGEASKASIDNIDLQCYFERQSEIK